MTRRATVALRERVGRLAHIRLTYQLLTLAVLLTLWSAAATGQSLFTPTPQATFAALVELSTHGDFWDAFLISNQALFIGLGISIVLGVPIGIWLARSRAAELSLSVFLDVLIILPMAAVVPLVIIAIGINLAGRVLIVVLFAIVMVIVNSRAGVKQVDPSLVDMARLFGANERQVWTNVLLPSALPGIMAGIRLGVSRAVLGMVIVELLMVSVGIGGLIQEFRGMFAADKLYATVLVVVAEALLLLTVASWLQQRVAPWTTLTRRARRRQL